MRIIYRRISRSQTVDIMHPKGRIQLNRQQCRECNLEDFPSIGSRGVQWIGLAAQHHADLGDLDGEIETGVLLAGAWYLNGR